MQEKYKRGKKGEGSFPVNGLRVSKHSVTSVRKQRCNYKFVSVQKRDESSVACFMLHD